MDTAAFNPSLRRTVLSMDGLYRYTLWREFDLTNSRYVMFLPLNPSTADATEDDRSVRRMVDFAKRWGFGAMCVGNLFAFRATEPAVMKAAVDPVGPHNDAALLALASQASLIVAAWGTDGAFRSRADDVARLMPKLHCLVRNKDGSPRHPLYVRAETRPSPYP